MPVLLENLLLHTVKGGDLKRFGLAMKFQSLESITP